MIDLDQWADETTKKIVETLRGEGYRIVHESQVLLVDDEGAVERLARAMGATSTYIDISWYMSYAEWRVKKPPIPKEYLEVAENIIAALRAAR